MLEAWISQFRVFSSGLNALLHAAQGIFRGVDEFSSSRQGDKPHDRLGDEAHADPSENRDDGDDDHQLDEGETGIVGNRLIPSRLQTNTFVPLKGGLNRIGCAVWLLAVLHVLSRRCSLAFAILV